MINSVFSPTSVCSSGVLRACLSNSNDALMKESLQEIVHYRLHGREADYNEEDIQESSMSAYTTIDDSAATGKYAALFTFTSNRYHYTPLKSPCSVSTVPENYEDALIWEDVKRSGLVFWYRNKSVFTHLALRIAMVGFMTSFHG